MSCWCWRQMMSCSRMMASGTVHSQDCLSCVQLFLCDLCHDLMQTLSMYQQLACAACTILCGMLTCWCACAGRMLRSTQLTRMPSSPTMPRRMQSCLSWVWSGTQSQLRSPSEVCVLRSELRYRVEAVFGLSAYLSLLLILIVAGDISPRKISGLKAVYRWWKLEVQTTCLGRTEPDWFNS